ncbi:hypothetical protein EPI10_000846 [Gossypium australe]|uniref:Uncharacterized protein n=1 Tax=Gossypium australe TaxID=47621 RepID=A0A5B6V9I3_9ROSI|nr:hypothetical protein EPI10_000846 [Gossypium australe]
MSTSWSTRMDEIADEDDKYQQILERLNQIESTSSASSMFCGDKPLSHCSDRPTENVNCIGNRGGNPYSNTYNPSWRDHPNLR